jgi:hypothetical protein
MFYVQSTEVYKVCKCLCDIFCHPECFNEIQGEEFLIFMQRDLCNAVNFVTLNLYLI